MKKDCVIRQQYGDVCAADQLPMTIRYRPRIYIVNTDPRSKPGQHWTAFYFPRRGPAEFFDSLGHSPDHYHTRFKRVLLKNERRYKYNKIRVTGYWNNDVWTILFILRLLQMSWFQYETHFRLIKGTSCQ